MRVAFDMTAAVAGETGIAVYATELSRALERQGVEVARFSVGRRVRPVPDGSVHVDVPLRVLERTWAMVGRPRAERFVGPVDLVHAAGPVPVPSRHPVVAVVHDLSPLDHPTLHPARARRELARTLAWLPRAARIATVSAATRDALVRHGVAAERITVTPNGRRELGPPDERLVPPGRFVLAVGQLAARKRLDVVLRAAALLPPDVGVVLCGPDAGEGAGLRALVRELGLQERVHFTGFATDGELAGLYRGAVVVVAASQDEGFGLPLLEAMAEGAPLVASDIPAFVEVAGEAAAYAPVGDHAALAHLLQALLDDTDRRDRRIAAGLERSRSRTWDACASATIAVYRSIVG